MLSKSEQKFLADYKGFLQKPKWKVILIYGLSWAVLMIIFTTAFDYFIKGHLPGRDIWFRLLYFPLGGLAYGLFFRWYVIRRCKKLKGKQAAA